VSLAVTIGRVVWRGGKAAAALAAAVVGLTWLNLVASAVMSVGGSCGGGGPYEISQPCPGGAWMAPVGIFVGLAGLALYALWRPSGSPSLLVFAWPALFGSLGVQFLRAAADETEAWGFWLCGVLFLVMAAAPVAVVLSGDRREAVRLLVGDGWAEPEPADRGDLWTPQAAPMVPVTFVTSSTAPDDEDLQPDLAESLGRLSRLHRCGDLSDAEFADAKQQVLDGA
jgi:hypothetical protein